MSTVHEYLFLFFLLLIAIVPLVVILLGSLAVYGLSKAQLQPVSEERSRDIAGNILRLRPEVDEWTRSSNCELVGFFHLSLLLANIDFLTWRIPESPTYFSAYLYNSQRLELDFTSIAAGSIIEIATGTTKDEQVFPECPGSYRETFSDLSIDDLWKRHQAAVKHISTLTPVVEHNVSVPDTNAFEVLFIDSVRRRARYVRSHFLWPLRIPYWHFVRKERLHGKPISEQSVELPAFLYDNRPEWTQEQQANPFSSPQSD